MAKASPLQTNFTSGEISPLMMGRVDTAKYQNGAKILENFIVRTQGGATRRGGFRWENESKFSSRVSRVKRFEFSDTQAYALEFGHFYIRVYKNNLPLLNEDLTDATHVATGVSGSNNGGSTQITSTTPPPRTITAVANNGAGLYRITTSIAHEYYDGAIVNISATGIASANATWTIAWVSPTQFDLVGSVWAANGAIGTAKSLNVRVGSYVKIVAVTGAYNGYWRVKSVEDYNKFTVANFPYPGVGSGTASVYCYQVEEQTPYDAAYVNELYFAQSADVLYITHKLYPWAKLQRFADDDWSHVNVTIKDGPYLPLRSNAPSIDPTDPARGVLLPDVYFELTNYAHTAAVKSAADFTDTVDDDGNHYIEYRQEDDQWRLAKILIASISGGDLRTAAVEVVDNVLLFLDETIRLKNSKDPLTVGGLNATPTNRGANVDKKADPNNEWQTAAAGLGAGTLTAQFSGTFGTPDIGKFVRYHDNTATAASLWAQITGIPTTTGGAKAKHAAALTMAAISTSGAGKFALVSETRVATLKSYKALSTYGVFTSADVGRLIRLGFSGRWTWGKITAYTSTSEVTVQLYQNMPRDPHNAANLAGDGMTFDWRLGAWSARTGYPAVCCFHEQRLWFGRSNTEPQTIWGSLSGDFESLAPSQPDSTVLDSDGITYTMVSGEVNALRWMSAGAVLLIGGLGQEWQVRAASSIQEPITQTNVVITPQTYYGSYKNVVPQRIGSATMFVNRGGVKVRELSYNYEIDAFVARDVSIISEHILVQNSKATASALQRDPVNIYWLVLGNGQLAAMTYEKDQEVVAWTRQMIGGSGVAESIDVVPSMDGLTDYVHVIVKRTINGVTKRYLEVLDGEFSPSSVSDKTNMFFVDGGTSFNLSSRVSFEALDYLEGQTVQIVADGVQLADQVVTGGKITLSSAAVVVQVGLKYESKAQTIPTEGGAVLGTSQIKRKRVNKFGIRVLNTARFKHASQDSSYQEKTFNANLNFFTGSDVVDLEQAHDLEGSFWIKQDRAEPLTILALTPEIKVNEEQ